MKTQNRPGPFSLSGQGGFQTWYGILFRNPTPGQDCATGDRHWERLGAVLCALRDLLGASDTRRRLQPDLAASERGPLSGLLVV
jgi:hypothetical protein